ncbi:helix-turn-helix domain-containing protein [Rhodococcus erythropolis]|uniref:helix-turn-helix domain-containing protein n=1 Tax=Rhodococcus erythropolis TaxID=1833 RepID=UPI001BEBE0A3|nr:helix-turn-helix transcriptional regulator [Rhodococcus erythropolis]MBT2268813.1 helix-turn-helix domain-containing protein [Rhodococcus erythropolis]
MPDTRQWFSEMTDRRITVTEIADHLGVTRKTAQTRIAEGLSSDDLITLCRALNVNPVCALTELGRLTDTEVFAYMDSDGTTVETADDAQLAVELARRLDNRLDQLLKKQADPLNGRPSGVGPVRLTARAQDQRRD